MTRAAMDKTVLLDMTPLDTPSRYRGFGRYVRDLAIGLSRLPPDEKQGLHIVGLSRLGWTGSYEITEDIGSFEGHPDMPEPAPADYYRHAYRRRVALWRAVRNFGASLVHIPDPKSTPLLRGLARCTWLVTCHDLIPLLYPERYLTARDGFGIVGKRLEQRRYRSADHVVAISETSRTDLLRLVELKPESVTRVYNGIDLGRWRRAMPAHEQTERLSKLGLADRKFLIFAGDLDWRKNVDGMMGGLACARSQGAQVELVLAGLLSETRAAQADETAQRCGVSAWVHRLGHVSDPDLVALFRGSVAHLFVSRCEGFGLPLVEAMACGCPVITSRTGSLAEVAGDAAWLVDPEGQHEIGDAIAAMVGSEEVRQRYITRGHERAAMFSNERQAKEMAALYRRLVDQGSGALSSGAG